MKNTRFAPFVWFVLGVNLLVILWGAYVRATGSGAGCGSHWPLCNGVIVPLDPQSETIVEFTHRLTSGIAFLLVAGMTLWAYRIYPRKNPIRRAASFTMLFMISEALVGAGLVLFEWVARDMSVGRVISISVHLVNTFLLLASLTLTGWWASGAQAWNLKNRGAVLWAFGFGFLGVMVIGVTGAITALGDTLFPAESLLQGLNQDFSATAHFLVRLRVWHPFVAIAVGFYLIFIAGVIGLGEERPIVRRFSVLLIGLVLIQWIAGLVNVALLAPLWMQLVHLLIADLVWITWVLFSASYLAPKETEQQALVTPVSESTLPGLVQ